MTVTDTTTTAVAQQQPMQITVSRAELAAGITWAAKGLPRRPAVPVLAGMRLEVSAGVLELAGFDYEMTAKARVFGETDGAGVILVNGAELAAVVKSLPKGTARQPVMVALSAVWPEPVQAPEAPAELHEYAEQPDDKYAHLVWGACSCGWTRSGATSDYVARAAHAQHVTTEAPEVFAYRQALADANAEPTATLTIAADGITSQLASLPMDEYPALPELPPVAGVFGGDALARSLARVAAAAGTDDTLPVLTCMRFELEASSVALAATDRYRLATDTVTDWTPADPGMVESVNVPAAEFGQFVKAVKGASKVTMFYAAPDVPENERGFGGAGAHVGFGTDERTLIIRSSAGDFPRYRALLPSEHVSSALVDARALADAVNRAGQQSGRNEAVHITLNGAAKVTARRDGAEVSTQSVPCDYSGDEMTVAYNPAYLASLLAGVSGQARLQFVSPAKPLDITSADEADTFRALLMPIRLQQS